MTVLDAYQMFNERHPGAVSRSTSNALRPREKVCDIGTFVDLNFPGQQILCWIRNRRNPMRFRHQDFIGSVEFLGLSAAEIEDLRSKSTSDTFVVAQIDFSMNYTLIRQCEVRQGFFSQHQVTLFTIHLTIGNEQRNLAIISSHMEHTTAFVNCAQKILAEFIKKNFPLIEKVNYVSDGASAYFKNNFSIFNLAHLKTDFGLDACWTFIAAGHGKSAGDGVGAVLKSTARHTTLSKNVLMSNAKDFFEFSQKQQLEIARRSNKDTPGVHVFYLESDEVEEVKKNCLKKMNVGSTQLKIFPACLPTLNPSSPNFKSRFPADVVLLVEAQNTHIHTDTRYKYLPKSIIDPETGDIRMRRSHPMINNFNEYIISACRSNMDVKFIWTGNNAIRRSRKFVLLSYNTLVSQQELSGVQVASYLMNWTIITELNDLRVARNLETNSYDTQERYCRAILTLFVPCRTVSDLCDVSQKWEDALSSRQHHISAHSQNIIDNIQLLHECKKDRDEHLVKVITEAQVENDTINPELFRKNQSLYDEYDDTSDSEDLLELLGNLNNSTTVAMNSMKKSTENVYIDETIEAIEQMGRFSYTHSA
ncbi:unnamed protein product [Adineta ricciae]|uniref:Uncharacterized protein n=1 Tax=Adineta ricciae TaxID=249248 RepID=A0A815U9R1_ADIRI|nr:unnamed protein product [Adineta ricciae]